LFELVLSSQFSPKASRKFSIYDFQSAMLLPVVRKLFLPVRPRRVCSVILPFVFSPAFCLLCSDFCFSFPHSGLRQQQLFLHHLINSSAHQLIHTFNHLRGGLARPNAQAADELRFVSGTAKNLRF
jgi:hypothetical protein